MFSTRNARANQHLPIAPGFNYVEALQERVHRPLLEAQYRPDVVHPGSDLSGYHTLVIPFLYCLDEDGLRARLRAWVEQGGTLIIGPLSDVRNEHLAKYTHAPFGSLEEWAGVYCKYSVASAPDSHELTWLAGGQEFAGGVWADGFEARGAEELALWADGPLRGLAAATQRAMGRGRVVLLGSLLPSVGWELLLRDLGVRPLAPVHGRHVVAPREGAGRRGVVLVELAGEPVTLPLAAPGVDLLSGEECAGEVAVEPYGVRVIEYRD